MTKKTYNQKLEDWLNNFNGKLPTYDKLVSNFIARMNDSVNRNFKHETTHQIEFPTPTVLYDHTLPTYKPSYEYETFMFNRLMGMLSDKGLVDISLNSQLLGEGQDASTFRPYEVTLVTFDERDISAIKEALSELKEKVSDSVIANLAVKLL